MGGKLYGDIGGGGRKGLRREGEYVMVTGMYGETEVEGMYENIGREGIYANPYLRL